VSAATTLTGSDELSIRTGVLELLCVFHHYIHMRLLLCLITATFDVVKVVEPLTWLNY